MGFSRQEYWSGLPFSSPVDHILSHLSTMTRPSWVAPQAWLGFIELDKAVVLVWLDWLVFCEYGFIVSALWCPLATPTILLGFLLPGVWGYLFMATPAKHSHCSLPWMRGISLLPPFLTFMEELYKKDLHDPDNHDGVITDLEPDILECEVKWALESITMNKASGGDGISVELFSNPERWCCESAALNMPVNLENSAVATGLEKVSFHSNPKEKQCQRILKLPHNCTQLTCY